MKGEARRACCGWIFFAKATLAFLLGLGGLGYYGFRIYNLYKLGLERRPLPSIRIPDANTADASACQYRNSSGLARLEPPGDHFFWGFSLMWDRDLPTNIANRIGRRPSIINNFINVNNTSWERDMINWNAQETGKIRAILELTVVFTVPIETITDNTLFSLAQQMRFINSEYGCPVLLRFGHEMNGPWLPNVGMKPRQYRQAFVTMSSYVRSLTNLTAMVWAPNSGNGYPYRGSGYEEYIPTPNHPDPIRRENFDLMDTNRNGQIDADDDPYLPYWPGAEWVDWVGISVYNFDRDTNGQSAMTPLTVFSDPGRSTSLVGRDAVHNFYDRFVVGFGKPFFFPETGSSYQTDVPTNARRTITINPADNQERIEVETKQSWWNAIVQNSGATPGSRFPRLKGAVWFEEVKVEQSYADATLYVNRDYRIATNQTVLQTFVRDMDALGERISWAGRYSFKCDGSISIS